MAGRTTGSLPQGVGAFLDETRTAIDAALQTASANAPASATAAGVAGQLAYDATHLYVCISTNVWVRVAIATWP